MSQQLVTPKEQYAHLVETFLQNPIVHREGKGFASMGLKVNGKSFVIFTRDKLVLKLPRERVEALVSSGAGERFDPRRNGRLMKEWLVLESSAEADWVSLAQEALEFVASVS